MPAKPQIPSDRIFILSGLLTWAGSIWIAGFALCIFLGTPALYAAQDKIKGPVIINGDSVEYATDKNEATASGNVVVVSGDTRLSCQKMTINTETKDAQAEGNVRIEDPKGIIEGSRATYNFQTKSGIIFNANFKSAPFFGQAQKIEKISDAEFIALKGYATTCSFDHPHYRLSSKKVDFFPHDKIEIRGTGLYVGDVPILYLPQYVHSFKDPLMHVQLMPGTKKDWGAYMLSAWRYQITDNVTGRVYFDWRQKLGLAEGFGANYTTPNIGKGDLKYYYAYEDDKSQPAGDPNKFRRYMLRWRHKWDIDNQTNVVSEYYKIVDSKRKQLGTDYNILKDYFPREYEKDEFPLSYALFHHSFGYSSADILVQPRTNSWYTQLEKLPEVKYSIPSMEIGDTLLYFDNNSSFAQYNSAPDGPHYTRLDTTNKFSRPLRVAFVNLTPFVASRQTYYDKDVNGNTIPPRTVFYAGADASTKFYRVFNVHSNFLRLDINGLRHIITPTIAYTYNHTPTILNSKLKQIDSVDAITASNAATLQLSNKLQTKREGKSVDLVDILVTTNYNFKPNTTDKHGGNLSDFLYRIKLLPYSWMRFEATATYNRSVPRSDPNYNRFTDVNYNITFDFQNGRSFGLGQRYERGGGNEITASFNWRLNPKWKISIYECYNMRDGVSVEKGFREQQYIITRDLHCWSMDLGYDVSKDSGNTVWLIFRLKAFPEMEIPFDQIYHQPASGSQ
ncbi:MAG: LptA/OstA family protein [Candidatus Omnitrophica bacterium]|nr:LptA/OstA family protein [Candidatus Omnitrophota bacterium]